MTARVSQGAVLVLEETSANARISEGAIQILWGVAASARVQQAAIMWLGRRNPRRTVGVTY